MANVTDMGNGKYRVIISNGYTDSGKRIRHTETITAKSFASAEKKAKQIEVECWEKTKEKQVVKFKEIVDNWEKIEKCKLAPLTKQGYEGRLHDILLAFGDKEVESITVLSIENFLQELRENGTSKGGYKKGLSEQTVKHYYSFLHRLFECGIKWDMCSKNPCHLADTPKVARSNRQTYSPEEVKSISKALRVEAIFIFRNERKNKKETVVRRYKREGSKRILNRETLRNIMFILTELGSGCRKGELLGLEWKDIDFSEKTISIKRVSQQVIGCGIVTKNMPKTDTSIREIVIPNQISRFLKRYKGIQDRARKSFDEEFANTDRVFTQHSGKPMSYNSINKWFNKFTEDYGFGKLSIHELRHTHISNLINMNVDVVSVSKRAGHCSPTVTLNVYAHEIAGADKKASDTMGRIMF